MVLVAPSPVRSPEKPVPFVFGETTPDPKGFPKPQRVVAALHNDRALVTEPLRFAFAPAAFEPTFAVGVEEHRGVCSAATGQQLPIPGLGDSDNR